MSADVTDMNEDFIKIEINGKLVKARRGEMIIEAADNVGIDIPRFCYHKKLSVAANCRMCLIQVEKVPKPLPACATPVTDGMKVYTRSPMAIDAQRDMMEFLLINHPLDCPICDQGGECDLQEVSMGYGGYESSFQEVKRVVADKNIGPLISTEMTRCIHCTRCVRFGDEIAGVRELGATGRGENTQIGTYIAKTIDSELSGNIIDLCPVGALTSKPFRFTARAWEMQRHEGIAAHDCVGSNTTILTRDHKVMRVDPRENEAINESWLSDRDRFSYEALSSSDRVTQPMIKKDGEWQQVDWAVALEHTVDCLRAVIKDSGTEQIGALASPSATSEEHYLFQKLMRGLGCANIDHRLSQIDFSDQDQSPAANLLGMALSDLDTLDSALLIGANIRKDQPIVGHRLRKSTLSGGAIAVIDSIDHTLNFDVAAKLIVAPNQLEAALSGVAKVMIDKSEATPPEGLVKLVDVVETNDEHRAIADALLSGQKSAVIVSQQMARHPQASRLIMLANAIARLSDSSFGYLTAGANSTGAALSGVLPHRMSGGAVATKQGLNAHDMLSDARAAYVLLNVDPELDCANASEAMAAMNSAGFVVSLASYQSDEMKRYADVILPVSTATETSGSFANIENRWQSFTGAVKPLGEARPAWKVLRVLGNYFDIQGFGFITSEDVLTELQAAITDAKPNFDTSWQCPEGITAADADDLIRIADLPIYAIDGTVRRASSLQKTADSDVARITIAEALATRLGLQDAKRASAQQNGNSITLPLNIDNSVPDGCVLIPTGLQESCNLGLNASPIELTRADGS